MKKIILVLIISLVLISGCGKQIEEENDNLKLLKLLEKGYKAEVGIYLSSQGLEKIDEVLLDLKEDEFELKFKINGRGFAGNITEKGFNKLIENPYVEEIEFVVHWDTPETLFKKRVSECIYANRNIMYENKLGQIGIIFNENVTLEKAQNLLKSYSLNDYENNFPENFIVTISKGEEVKWMCVLEESQIVKQVAFVFQDGTLDLIKVQYSFNILEKFDDKEWVRINVRLKDYSKIDEVLITLLEDEFKLDEKTTKGFGGEMSKKGFNKLINDERVDAIYELMIVGTC